MNISLELSGSSGSGDQGGQGITTKVLDSVWKGAKVTCDAAHRIKEDTNTLARVFKLGIYGLSAVQLMTGRPAVMSFFTNRMNNGVNLIDTFQIGADTDYFVNGQAQEDWKDPQIHVKSKVVASAGFFVADFNGLLMWLDELNLLRLANWAASIEAKIPIFKYAIKIGLGAITRAIVGVSFGILAYNAIKKWCMANDVSKQIAEGNIEVNRIVQVHKRQAIYELIWTVSEVALQIFVLSYGAAFGIITLGLIAATTGIASFLHQSFNKLPLNQSLDKHLSSI